METFQYPIHLSTYVYNPSRRILGIPFGFPILTVDVIIIRGRGRCSTIDLQTYSNIATSPSQIDSTLCGLSCLATHHRYFAHKKKSLPLPAESNACHQSMESTWFITFFYDSSLIRWQEKLSKGTSNFAKPSNMSTAEQLHGINPVVMPGSLCRYFLGLCKEAACVGGAKKKWSRNELSADQNKSTVDRLESWKQQKRAQIVGGKGHKRCDKTVAQIEKFTGIN